MWLGVLGATVVRATAPGLRDDPAGDTATTLGAAKHRALLAALALQPGRPVSADALVDAIWGADAPPSAQATLHTYLSAVRRVLEPDLPPRTPSRYLVSSDAGYELRLGAGELDADTFARTVAEVHADLGALAIAAAPVDADPASAARSLQRLEAALALWRGEPYADVLAGDLVTAERARLADLRLLALEDRATLLVASGDAARAASDLEALTAQHPLRERLWSLLAVAQARTGRQADALATLDRLRRTLDDELGIEPSPAVRELHTAILRQEPAASTRGSSPPPAAAPAAAPPPVEISLPNWPLVGRVEHLDHLLRLLGSADAGSPEFGVLVGEPGVGKSRLAGELCLRAQKSGALVLVGWCSPDEDAPPLWPWTTALGGDPAGTDPAGTDPAGTDPGTGRDHDAARFAAADAIRRTLLALAADRTVVLVLEDLHWADPSSLRVLRHICAHARTGRLLVLCTWRNGHDSHLGDAAEALARRHATRIDLTGLSESEAGEMLRSFGGDVDPSVAAAARGRTEGNPFFLIEYARLARDEDRPLAQVLDGMPRSVSDVVRRRIHQLPAPSADALTAGAVIGREFEVGLLARELEVSEATALDLLEPALAVDLVRDLGGDTFRFGHALVRDTAYAELPPSRRERMHASVATLIAEMPGAVGRTAEVARHWAAAGERHVAQAWRAAAQAAELAMAAHATDEAAAHYRSALEMLARDPQATDRNRWDVLVGYADACRWSTRLVESLEAIDEAIAIADRLGEPALVVGAASVVAEGAIWQVRAYGVVNDVVVGAMRRALDRLPHEDSEVRCRLLLLLAGELFYEDRPAEIDALVEESLAMARRLGDPRLLLSVLSYGFSVRWRRGMIHAREAMAEEALTLARREGDVRTELVARFLLASVRAGLGELDGVEAEVAEVGGRARELRLYFLELATLTHLQSWAAMRGDADGIAANTQRLYDLDALISVPQKADALKGALLVPQLWGAQGVQPELVVEYVDGASIPIEPGLVVMLLRTGETDLARQVWADHHYEIGGDDWYRELHHAFGAEIALATGDRELGAALYERLLPLRGQCLISGTGPAHGPADAYLALAAAAAGETALAAEHAAVAEIRCQAWQIPQVARWLGDLRALHGF